MTDAERRLWHQLRDRRLGGYKFVRQEPMGPYVADFCCREEKLIVEVDGSQHSGSKRDLVRDAWLASEGYRVLRFWNIDVLQRPRDIGDAILAALPPHPSLSPPGGERGIIPPRMWSEAGSRQVFVVQG